MWPKIRVKTTTINIRRIDEDGLKKIIILKWFRVKKKGFES